MWILLIFRSTPPWDQKKRDRVMARKRGGRPKVPG